jgi:hypothetical protein
VNPTSGRCWWLAVDNVHEHHDGATAISLPEIAPFLDGREPCFRWPPQGDDRALYHQMETGDTALLWTGHNPEGYPGWGVLGFAQIYVRDIGLEYPEVLLSRDWFPDDVLVPFPAQTKAGPRARTPESDFLWEELGAGFEPLAEMFTQLGYTQKPRSPKTVYPIGYDAYMAVRHRMLMRAA